MPQVDKAAWLEWLNGSGTQPDSPTDDNVLSALFAQFKRSPSPATLGEIITGEFYDVVGGKVVRADVSEQEAAQLRRAGHIVRVEAANDLPGKPCRITILRRKHNLFSLCQLRSINRRAIAFEIEDLCRWHLVPGDPPAGLAQGRAIFRQCLMCGRPAGAPVAQAASAPAAASADPFAALKEEIREEADRGDPLASPAPSVGPAKRRHGLVRRQKVEAPAMPDQEVEADREAALRRSASMAPPPSRTGLLQQLRGLASPMSTRLGIIGARTGRGLGCGA